MQWSDTYLLGIPTVDSQHKRLLELFAELETAIDNNHQVDIQNLLKTLDQYKTRHFQLEEKYMAESGYPGLVEQQEAHQSFTALFATLRNRLAEEGYSQELAIAIKEELMQWIQRHVTGLDKAFGEYYREQGEQKNGVRGDQA